MKFIIKDASDWLFEEEININTLEELIKYIEEETCGDVIIYKPGSYDKKEWVLRNYNYYVE